MQPGEIVLVQLDAGPRLVRVIEPAGNRLRLAIGRNREARLPQSRVVYETGVSAPGFEAVEEFRLQSESALTDLDLEEVWDVVCDDCEPLTLTDIGELYLGVEPTVQQTVGILLHLLDDDLLFVPDGTHFVPRDRQAVAAMIDRRQRQQQRTRDAEELTAAFRAGSLPQSITEYQSEVIGQVRDFVLHGDDYVRARFVKRFLENAGVRGRDVQRAAFEKLVALEVMNVDEHLDLERNEITTVFPEEALEEAKRTDQRHLLSGQERADLTGLPTITIDDTDTRDRDDALSIESLEPGVYRVGIHITDAGALIDAGSALDVEADRRMSSLYLPEQTISMLLRCRVRGLGKFEPGRVESGCQRKCRD